MENPEPLAGAHVVAADMTWCGPMRALTAASTQHHDVFVDHHRAGELEGQTRHFVIEVRLEVENAVLGEVRIELARLRV